MKILRLSEWSRVRADWPESQRLALQNAAFSWQKAHGLNALPLEWSGADGKVLRARQWVGIVEIAGARVEILPKTEKSLWENNTPDENEANAALHDFLRLQEAAQFGDWVETDAANLGAGALTFADVWAYLLGKHLWRELRRGLPRAYGGFESDLWAPRGKILVARQTARWGERLDKTICAYDEFSPDTPLLQGFKCACRILRRLANHPVALGFLGDCLLVLDEVNEVSPRQALLQNQRAIWTRATLRFRPAYELARQILENLGPNLGAGSNQTWVFLSDMNRVFEQFVRVALEDQLGVRVEEQQIVGNLLKNPNAQKQIADYRWQSEGKTWIGDAKWKLLAGELDVADVRQLTVYGELERKNGGEPIELAIFTPGEISRRLETWNGANLHLVPVKIRGWKRPGESLALF